MAKNVYRGPSAGRRRGEREQDVSMRRRAESIRRTADDDYDDEDYEWQERETSRKARNGCLIVFLVVLLLVLATLIVGALVVRNEINGQNSSAAQPVTLDVQSGWGGNTLGEVLESNGMIGNGLVFRYYVQIKGVAGNFTAGRHTINPGMSYDEIIAELISDPEPRPTVEVRIREGVSIMSVASTFEEAGLCTAAEFLAEANNLENFRDLKFVQKLLEDFDPVVFHNAEGLLYPETYSFYVDDTVHNYVRKLYEQMDAVITEEMYARMDELGISIREALTLASVIQAEAGHAEQQPVVAGVFWNRMAENLPEGMRGTLGSDVTLRYVKIWLQWNNEDFADRKYSEIGYDEARAAVGDEMFYAYVTEDSDANTRIGLPTGPICSITVGALNAALNPDDHGYYYFLTDFYGNYYYAETYQKHLANVETMNAMNAQYEAEQAQEETPAETAGGTGENAIAVPAPGGGSVNFGSVHKKWHVLPGWAA